MFKGWRSRLHYHSRNKEGLKKWALAIVLGSFAFCWVVVQIAPQPSESEGLDIIGQGLRTGWRNLQGGSAPEPRRLSRWLRHFMPRVQHLSEMSGIDHPDWASYQATGKIADLDVRPLLRRHAPEPAAAALFEDFLAAYLSAELSNAPFDRIRALAGQTTPPPLANELHGALLLRAKREDEALLALLREARLFADAVAVREDAVRLALKLEHKQVLREIVEGTDWLSRMRGYVTYEAGRHLNDPLLIGAGLARHRLENLPLTQVLQALFAAALWYAILVLQSTPRRGRWWYPVLPMMAGVVSVWPTLWMGAWQELHLGMTEEAPFPQDLWFWVMGVGLREEAAKLALFALFLPWLLRKRDAGLALITGGFVGLGFALEENIDYYQEHGGGVALARFLSANFAHVALTGIAAHACYGMFRSRFHRADRFIAVFLAVVAIHGLYDFAASGSFEGSGYLTMALLAFTAWHFMDLLAHEAPAARQLIAPSGLFVIGTAALIAASFAISAFQQGRPEALVATAMECLAILPVGFVYWRRLQ